MWTILSQILKNRFIGHLTHIKHAVTGNSRVGNANWPPFFRHTPVPIIRSGKLVVHDTCFDRMGPLLIRRWLFASVRD